MVIKGVVMHTKKGMILSWEHFSRGKKGKEGILSEVWEIMEKKGKYNRWWGWDNGKGSRDVRGGGEIIQNF